MQPSPMLSVCSYYLVLPCFVLLRLINDIIKLDVNQFSVMGYGGVFDFVYYSLLHIFTFGGTPEITPVGDSSRAVSMLEQFFAILLLFILVSLFISVKGEKYKEELERTIAGTVRTGGKLETLIINDYHLSTDQALEEIKKIEGNF